MSYAGLGQTSAPAVSLPAHSALIVALQQSLMSAGLLNIRVADGVISSSSQTIAAIQAWATRNGLSATGVARTSSGGLTIPQSLLSAILGQAPAQPGAAPGAPGGGKDNTALPSAALPDVSLTDGRPGWVPWAIGGGTLVLLLGVGAVAMRR